MKGTVFVQFIMFGEFYENENQWVIYLWLIIRVNYAELVIRVSFMCLPKNCANFSFLWQQYFTSILLVDFKSVASICQKTNVMSKKTKL